MGYLLLLLVGLPLVTALAIQLLAAAHKHRVAAFAVTGAVATLLCAVSLMFLVSPASYQIGLAERWGILLLDPLSALLALVIAAISMIVQIYSVRYMADEPAYGRYFMLLNLTTGMLMLMVTAGDLLGLLIAWHLIGVLLFMLLGHNTRSQSAYRYATWTFLTFRFGDLPLVIAAVMLFQAFGTWSLSDIFAAIAADPDGHELAGYSLVNIVATLVALSAFVRSAQFLFHTWLPYTMEGPTPVSALMHAGIVNAGGFLINRFAPLYVHTDGVLHWVFIVGLVTAVIGSLLMLAQNDIKKALGYSTMGQMGFMIMECGVGAFSLAVFHLIAHGVFKGTLFLSAGSIIHEARKDDGIPKNELYTYLVERSLVIKKQPWLLMAIFTLLVPVTVLVLAHWVVDQELLQKQGAIILLFFGWVTGAQLIFVTYRMQTENLWRLISMVIISFIVVVVGYVLISHAFDLFLYPDQEFRKQIYAAAGIDVGWFDVLVVMVTATIMLGWFMIYYGEHRQIDNKGILQRLWISFYALISRELYIIDVYVLLSRGLVNIAARLNARLWWL